MYDILSLPGIVLRNEILHLLNPTSGIGSLIVRRLAANLPVDDPVRQRMLQAQTVLDRLALALEALRKGGTFTCFYCGTEVQLSGAAISCKARTKIML